MKTISASVGQNATNKLPDAVTVQQLLNKVPVDQGGPEKPLKVDGLAWGKTIAAIKRFQHVHMGHKWPDGRVDPGGKTLASLNAYDQPPSSSQQQPPAKPNVWPQYVWSVPGRRWLIGQYTNMTCWAATYAMMRSWHDGKVYTIEEALQKPGKEYVDLFEHNRGLPASKNLDFWTRGGLSVEGYASFPDYIWYDMLRRHGLLAVGQANGLPATGLHVRIVAGMSIRHAPTDSYHIMDPWGPVTYFESPFVFEAKYNLAMTIGPGAFWQVAHYY